ncbi:MAG: hypothetical protein WDN67_00910 [Candidatus Moraniibacteriota bacterium]
MPPNPTSSALKRIRLRRQLKELDASKEASIDEEAYDDAARYKEAGDRIGRLLDQLEQGGDIPEASVQVEGTSPSDDASLG